MAGRCGGGTLVALNHRGIKMNNADIHKAESGPRVLRVQELADMISVSKSTIYDWIDPRSPRYDPAFPVPKRLGVSKGRGSVGVLEGDLAAWLELRLGKGSER